MFDVQIKRLHEYKRQLMNALSIYDLYCEYKAGNLPNFTPTAFIFGAKSAPGYARAKAIIYFINRLAEMINADEEARRVMRWCSLRTTTAPWRRRSSPPPTSPSRSPPPAPKPAAPAT